MATKVFYYVCCAFVKHGPFSSHQAAEAFATALATAGNTKGEVQITWAKQDEDDDE